MSHIDELRTRYFVQDSDLQGDDYTVGERVPNTTDGNRVEYLIDGHAYFGALRHEIANLVHGGSDRYFYMTTWWLGLVDGPERIRVEPQSLTSAWASEYTLDADSSRSLDPFELNDGSNARPYPQLIDRLEDMARAGVDVRVLAWVSPLLLNYERFAVQERFRIGREWVKRPRNLWVVNVHTMLSAYHLRNRESVNDYNVVLNTLAHPLGAMHVKMIVCGNDRGMRAYVSGLDPVSNRIAGNSHMGQDEDGNPMVEPWHDVGVRVQGPAATAIYHFYQQLWNEQATRIPHSFRISGHVIGSFVNDPIPLINSPTPVWVQDRIAPALGQQGTQHVQVLRTTPQMNIAARATQRVPALGITQRLFGGFSQEALNLAENAEDGIFEFRLALRKAIAAAQQYIYIEDQGFQAWEIMKWINQRLKSESNLKVIMLYGADPADPPNDFLAYAINDHLLRDIDTASDHIVFYKRGGDIVVHSKVTIIDDEWVAVGSANCMRRSLYTDGELSISVIDDVHDPEHPFARSLRKDLWGELCRKDQGVTNDALFDLNRALGIWDDSWGSPPQGIALRNELEKMELPFVVCPLATGTVEVREGSRVVTGSGTTWNDFLIGQSMKIVGIGRDETYIIAEVDSSVQLRLHKPYEQPTGADLQYKISEHGKWLLDELPRFNQHQYDLLDPDSRLEY